VADNPVHFQKPLSARQRREVARAEMVNAILDAARVVMRRDGVAALNLNEVARMVGIQTPGLYRYFAGKMAIYDALFQRAITVYRPRLEQVWADRPPGWQRLEAWLEARMRFAQDHPDLDRLFLSRDVPGFVPSAESMAKSGQFLSAALQAFEESFAACALARGIDPSRARGLFFATMHGLTLMHLANEPDQPVGSGFYGSLIPDAIAMFRHAWTDLEQGGDA
jgi:AcrR family transcriptional regulator